MSPSMSALPAWVSTDTMRPVNAYRFVVGGWARWQEDVSRTATQKKEITKTRLRRCFAMFTMYTNVPLMAGPSPRVKYCLAQLFVKSYAGFPMERHLDGMQS